jgi:YD repeat-containing protein
VRDAGQNSTDDSLTYTFVYDDYGNTTEIKVGTYTLVTYEYEPYNGKLIKTTYGTGMYVKNVYDELDRIIAIKVGGEDIDETTKYTYSYNGNGDLYEVTDVDSNTTSCYNYDSLGRLLSSWQKIGDSVNSYTYYSYDDMGRACQSNCYLVGTTGGALSQTYVYTYDDDDGFNMYAYCGNNPVARSDDGGEFWHIVAGAAISAGFELAGQLISNGGNIKNVDWLKVGKSAAIGAVTSAIGLGVGALASKVTTNAVAQTAIRIAGEGVNNVISDALSGDINSFDDAKESFINGTVSGAVGEGLSFAVKKIRLGIFNSKNSASKKYTLTNKETGDLIMTAETKHCFTDTSLKPINTKKHFPDVYEKFSSVVETVK